MAARSREARRRAQRFGRLAEACCRWRLRVLGWRILARDWRTPVGEIDIVARRGRVIAFVEVKGRAKPGAEVAAPTPRQRRRIARSAELYLARHPQFGALCGRFDVMLVEPWPSPRFLWPTHIRDAWRHEPR
jgi:putative endonuclease